VPVGNTIIVGKSVAKILNFWVENKVAAIHGGVLSGSLVFFYNLNIGFHFGNIVYEMSPQSGQKLFGQPGLRFADGDFRVRWPAPT
jgi:hypothetical protein